MTQGRIESWRKQVVPAAARMKERNKETEERERFNEALPECQWSDCQMKPHAGCDGGDGEVGMTSSNQLSVWFGLG